MAHPVCPRPKLFKMFTSQVLIIHNASAVFLNSLSVAAERIRTLPATFHVEAKTLWRKICSVKCAARSDIILLLNKCQAPTKTHRPLC